MITKRVLLLAVSVMALVAFSVPAAAQANAPEWLTEGVAITEPEELHIVGELGSLSSTGLTNGPCEVTLEGVAENTNGMAGGNIEGGAVNTPCPTNKANCEVSSFTLNIGAGWNVTGATVTGGEGFEIKNASYTKHFNSAANCGLPITSVTATGTITGTIEEGCLSFEGHKDEMNAFGGLVKVDLEGTFCDTHLTLG